MPKSNHCSHVNSTPNQGHGEFLLLVLNFIDLYISCIVTLIIQNKFAPELFLWLHLPGELPDKSESFLIRLVCEMCHLFPAWKTITLHTYHQINPFNLERNHHSTYREMSAFPKSKADSKEYFLVILLKEIHCVLSTPQMI